MGKYEVGDIRKTDSQIWECFQAHDNAEYPDITPDDPSWFTFWKPLHGNSKDTARPFVSPTGSYDIYHKDEWMIYNKIYDEIQQEWTEVQYDVYYKCVQDTNFSPEEFPDAWEFVE